MQSGELGSFSVSPPLFTSSLCCLHILSHLSINNEEGRYCQVQQKLLDKKSKEKNNRNPLFSLAAFIKEPQLIKSMFFYSNNQKSADFVAVYLLCLDVEKRKNPVCGFVSPLEGSEADSHRKPEVSNLYSQMYF